MVGATSGELLTYGGRPIVHPDRAELEWLFPGQRIVRVTERDLVARSPLPPLQLRDHPDLAGWSWPLDRRDFR